jgi:two-component system, cell cycle sensor histidine kinase and response regulator CckA
VTKTQILIVEDEGIVAKDLQAMLRRLGYHVPVTVGTGELAIQTAIQNQPDLVLMDIQLRGSMDGVQASAAIAEVQDVPILYLTANSDQATFQRARDTDPFGFVIKPFEERSLQASIEMALYKHKTEKRIRDREQWLSTTLSSIADAVITTDCEGRVTFLNAAAQKLCGWDPVEAFGRPYPKIFQVLDERTRAVALDKISFALTEGSSWRSKTHAILRRADGTETFIEHSVAPIRHGADGRISGCVVVFSDVSEQKRLEERLRQVQKMDAIGKLAGGIAHDFNNAITAIIGYAEMIQKQIDSPQMLHRNAKQIVRAAEHSARLTHQLLAFSRKQVLHPRCLDLKVELAEIEGMVRRLIGENIVLKTEAESDLWNTMADAGHIQQVILNMAINARDAMPHGGHLTIGLSNVTVSPEDAVRIPEGRAGDFARLTITDTGMGMSREVMGRIFEPFFTTKEPGKGTGLGLATCYGIIQQTSGMIAVSSEVGVGTTFSVYFPRSAEARTTSEYGVATESLPVGSETILLVEDEDILRELVVQVLENLGYRVLAARDGIEAMEILSNSADVSLVMTDLVMPRMSGRELVMWVDDHVGAMRVLLMSGYTDDELIRSAIEGAEIAYLQKPFAPKALAQRVRQLLDRPKVRLFPKT